MSAAGENVPHRGREAVISVTGSSILALAQIAGEYVAAQATMLERGIRKAGEIIVGSCPGPMGSAQFLAHSESVAPTNRSHAAGLGALAMDVGSSSDANLSCMFIDVTHALGLTPAGQRTRVRPNDSVHETECRHGGDSMVSGSSSVGSPSMLVMFLRLQYLLMLSAPCQAQWRIRL